MNLNRICLLLFVFNVLLATETFAKFRFNPFQGINDRKIAKKQKPQLKEKNNRKSAGSIGKQPPKKSSGWRKTIGNLQDRMIGNTTPTRGDGRRSEHLSAPTNAHARRSGHLSAPTNVHARRSGHLSSPTNVHARRSGHLSAPTTVHARRAGHLSAPTTVHARRAGHLSAPTNVHARRSGHLSAPTNAHARRSGHLSAPTHVHARGTRKAHRNQEPSFNVPEKKEQWQAMYVLNDGTIVRRTLREIQYGGTSSENGLFIPRGRVINGKLLTNNVVLSREQDQNTFINELNKLGGIRVAIPLY